jgi:hypothetical protein
LIDIAISRCAADRTEAVARTKAFSHTGMIKGSIFYRK